MDFDPGNEDRASSTKGGAIDYDLQVGHLHKE